MILQQPQPHQQQQHLWGAPNELPAPSTAATTRRPSEEDVPPEILEALRTHSIFQRSNNPQFLEQVACSLVCRTYGPRDVIIAEGEAARAMFFILRGSVDVCSPDSERIYATLRRGACFGEIGILYSMPRTATVMARTATTVGVLTADKVAALLPAYPDVEQVLRFEAQERLALLQKTKYTKAHDEQGKMPGARQLLDKVSFFHQCPEAFLHHISLCVEPRNYVPNSTIIHKGDIGTEMYFIVDGKLHVAS